MNEYIKSLEILLADTYALFLKTQNYHWNVECREFKSLHELFEAQYDDLYKAIDVLAELIRELDVRTIGTFADFSSRTTIKDGDRNADVTKMLSDLYSDQCTIEKTLKDVLDQAENHKDEVVIGFIVDRLNVHRKNKWMLKSSMR